MKNKKLFKWSDSKLYLIVIAVLVGIIAIYQPILAIIGALVLGYIIFYSFRSVQEKNKDFTRYIEDLTDEFDSATKQAVFNMPFPLVLIDENGSIKWYNTPFLEMMVEDEILNERLYDLVPNISLDEILKGDKDNPINLNYGDKFFKVYPNFVETKKNNITIKTIMLYWVDNTDYVLLDEFNRNDKTILGLVYVDNYDDVKSSTLDVNRPIVLAEIDKQVNSYFSQYNGIVRKYENDKYLVVINNEALEDVEARKFDLLDYMRELNVGNTIPITLSIGMSSAGDTLLESY